MKTLIINLDRSVERMESMRRLAMDLGLDYERVPAVDGAAVDAEIRCRQRETAVFPPSDGELGCFLSHWLCWKKIAEGDDDVVLVLEDDVVLLSADRDVLIQAKSLASYVDLVRLEGHWAKVWVDRQDVSLSNSYRAARLRSGAIGSGAYLVSKSAAQKLLDLYPSYRRPVDLALYADLHDKLDIRIVLPAPFAQGYLVGMAGAFSSTIEARSVPRRIVDGALPRRIIGSVARRWERIIRYLSGQRRTGQMQSSPTRETEAAPQVLETTSN